MNADLDAFNDRLNKLAAKFYKIVLPGTIAEIRHDDVTLARVTVVPTEDSPTSQTTDFIPVFQPRAAAGVKMWLPVAVGDSGILVSPGGMLNSGWFITGLYSAPPPSSAMTGVAPPLAGAERDSSAVLQIGDITFRLDAAAGTVRLVGTTGVHLDGNLRVVGSISAKDDITTDAGISHNHHIHIDSAGLSAGATSEPK